ncbi:MAG: type 4a pilus biogenesis protein PilO [Myxococcota bacterium]|nr:type 4a pilus biogenesis protein PilO [Myxococcota bacterium]
MAITFNFDFEEQLDQIAKVPKPVRLAVAVALLASVAAGYWFVSYQPKGEKVDLLQGKIQKLERQLSNIRAVASNLEAFEQEVAFLEARFKRARRRLPEGKQFEDLLSDITTAGKKVGVRIKSIERQPEVPHDFYAEVPFRVELDGSYHDLARFFEQIGSLPRIVNVGDLDVRVDQEYREATNLRIQGTATTFRFLRDQDQPGGAP